MTTTVRYDADPYAWYFGEERRRHNGGDSIIIKRNDLRATTATDLARAFRWSLEVQGWPESVLIDTAPDDIYEPKESIVEAISFCMPDGQRLAVQCDVVTDDYLEDDAALHARIASLIEPLLKRHNAMLVSAKIGHRTTPPFIHEVLLTTSTRGKTLETLFQIGENVTTLIDAARAGLIARDTVLDLVLGGRADLLVGQPEGPWLDVKSHHYDLTTPHGKISLAESVARFANAEEGGVVIVGMNTSKVSGGEVIKAVKPVPINAGDVRRYRQAIENRLFPFPTGLRVEPVEISNESGLVIIAIPPQEEELKPFLVHGAIVGGRVEGAYISIVRRSGEDSIPITAQQIHSTLAAGRALLRRGVLPPSKGE
ncbi:hypothetical protein [Nucisporomicrobium flavum]|uniref:hypothetical protein n=1 Tax=Nucisporomicrobium flavum TaxID=2785915 RepID=UPI0018F58888|nr:hypothetical protein [Nucisporomicrobium flavum]